MSPINKLNAIIRKAIDNVGWEKAQEFIPANIEERSFTIPEPILQCPYQLLFNHEFAKAFWGEEKLCFVCGDPKVCWCDTSDTMPPHEEQKLPAYLFYLQQAVLEFEPLLFYCDHL